MPNKNMLYLKKVLHTFPSLGGEIKQTIAWIIKIC